MAATTSAVAVGAGRGAGKGAALSAALGIGALKRSQMEVLQMLVSKHLSDPSLVDLASSEDFTVTSLERGIPRYEHGHLVAALDVFLAYQRNRRAQGPYSFVPSMRTSFKHDPRTRLIELYKRWLRTNAVNASIGEDEVRRMCALCRDVLNHPRLFPSRNPRSFMHTLAEVYDHLKLQLREVLEHDRTCAELASRALCLSRNLISDAVGYLLLAATDLKQTDKLPSVEVVYLWQSLPPELNPLPARADKTLQKVMKDAWATQCGLLISSILRVRWAFRLFDGAGAEDEAVATSTALALAGQKRSGPAADPEAHPAESVPALIAQVGAEFEKGNFKASGLAGAFRDPARNAGRKSYLGAAEAVFDLIYLLGDVLVQFHRLSDGLGDYGMIRVAPWLHPFLEALVDKVQRLRESLSSLNETVDSELVLAKARGQKVKKPTPTQTMSARAHAAIDRAVTGADCHAALLLQVFEELRLRSAPERLPHVMEGLGDACAQLQSVLASPQFLARVGDACRELPPLSSMTTVNQIEDIRPSSVVIEEVDGDMSEDEGSPKTSTSGDTPSGGGLRRLGSNWADSLDAPFGAAGRRSRAGSRDAARDRADSSFSKTSQSSSITGSTAASACLEGVSITGFHVRQRAASAGRAGRDALRRLTGHRTSEERAQEKVEAMKPDCASWVSADVPGDSFAVVDSPAERASVEMVAPATVDSSATTVASAESRAGSTEGDASLGRPEASGDAALAPRDPGSAPESAPATQPPVALAAVGQAAAPPRPPVPPPPPVVIAPVVPPLMDLKADVYRLTVALKGWKQHDLRCLKLKYGDLHIFEKGSKAQIKTVVNIAEEVDQCSLLGNGIMSLEIRRVKRPSLLCIGRAAGEPEGRERKLYLFEFCERGLAEVFHREVMKARGLDPGVADPLV